MKILVIDDTKVHLTAASQTLSGHEVTTCSDYDKAVELLNIQYDEEELNKRNAKYVAEGMDSRPAYLKARKETTLPYWDAVLCDLLMPAGRDAQGGEGERFVGQEMPVGWSLALLAASRGAKYVAVATDMNHHNHPASAMLDRLSEYVFTIDSARMLMTNRVRMVGIAGSECTCRECTGTGKLKRHDSSEFDCPCCTSGTTHTIKGKDWGKVFKQLLGNAVNE